MVDWTKFDKQVDIEGINADIEDSKNNDGNYKEVPEGEYEVKIEKLELTKSKKGDAMMSCWMKILEGEFAGSYLFYNQVAKLGFQIHLIHEFLRSLDSGVEINSKFNGYAELNDIIMDVFETIEEDKLEYAVNYSKNDKGYNVFEITDVFEG